MGPLRATDTVELGTALASTLQCVLKVRGKRSPETKKPEHYSNNSSVPVVGSIDLLAVLFKNPPPLGSNASVNTGAELVAGLGDVIPHLGHGGLQSINIDVVGGAGLPLHSARQEVV